MSFAERIPPWTAGLLLAVVYGVLCRLLGGFPGFPWLFTVMTVAFIFFVPLAMGFLTVYPHPAPSLWRQIFLPWLSYGLLLGVLSLVSLEGAICILMAAPVGFVMASLGGVLSARFARRSAARAALVLAFPLALGPVEGGWQPTGQVREVATQIEVDASAARIWSQIVSVAPISEAEQRPNFFHRIGFPRPVSAELQGEGVGSVRRAVFERGLEFVETVHDWEVERRLAFGIRADSAQIPGVSLDEHVAVGGPFFDVLEGRYTIEPRANGLAVLHLHSRYRLSTHFDLYAQWWTDAVMRDIQNYILAIVRDRCEAPVQPEPASTH